MCSALRRGDSCDRLQLSFVLGLAFALGSVSPGFAQDGESSVSPSDQGDGAASQVADPSPVQVALPVEAPAKAPDGPVTVVETPAPATEISSPAAATARQSSASASVAVQTGGSVEGEARLTLSFSNTPWNVVLEWFVEETEMSLQKDTWPTGTFSYTDTRRKYTISEALDAMNLVLMRKAMR